MTVLSVDIGGTKTLISLVDGADVVDRVEETTERCAGPESWVLHMANVAQRWAGRFDRAGITVTGLVKDKHWHALNPETLAIPGRFALQEAATKALGVPVTLCNDAQAAAWGEYVYGAGRNKDIIFLTVSTGIGGGIVTGGRLIAGRGGLAGHFGQLRLLPDDHEDPFENQASGRWIAAEGKKLGLPADARSVFTAADNGDDSAERILQTSARRVGRLCQNLQLMFDPQIIVIGGGIGLAPGYLERVVETVECLQPVLRPTFVRSALGKDAGVIGVADLSIKNQPNREESQ